MDASAKAIAGAVHQVVYGRHQPLGFFSRRTTPAESRYSAYDLELLAVYSTVLKFRHVLEGRRFKIFTDQKPLTSAFFKAKDPASNGFGKTSWRTLFRDSSMTRNPHGHPFGRPRFEPASICPLWRGHSGLSTGSHCPPYVYRRSVFPVWNHR